MKRVIFKCERCGREYDISKYAMNIRIKQNNFICRNCHTSDSIKLHWKNMSDEKKKARSDKLSIKTKEYFNNLSDEEKEKRRQDKINHYANLSDENKKKISDAHKKAWEDMLPDKKKAFIQSHLDYYANMSEEDHAKFVQSHKDVWKNKSKEEMEKFSQLKREQYQSLSEEEKRIYVERSRINWPNVKDKISEAHSRWLSNMSDDERKEFANLTKQRWDNMSEEERKDFIGKMHEWQNNPSDEKYIEWKLKRKQWYDNLSEDKKNEYNKKVSDGLIRYWSNASDEDKRNHSNKIKEAWKNMDDDKKINRSLKISNSEKDTWRNLSKEEKYSLLKNKGIVKKISGLNKKFESYWNKSGLSDKYHIVPEYLIILNQLISHRWDFAIFDYSDNLVCLVDLDGAYFHADICDYTGIKSKLFYDESRSMTIPNGVMHIIIQELNFDKCFDEFLLMMNIGFHNYNEYLFQIFRSIPFPIPQYSIMELLRSYDNLDKLNLEYNYYHLIEYNSRLGDRLIYHFHPSIWMNIYDDKISPYEAWNNDDILRKLINDNIIYQTHLNKNKILQGFNICDVAPLKYFISAGQWKLILYKYWDDDIYNINSDPNLLLACITLKRNCYGEYQNDTLKMVEFLNKYGIQYNIQCEYNNNIVAHVRDDDEMNDILSRYDPDKYLFVLDNTDHGCDSFGIRTYDNHKLYIITSQNKVQGI